MKTYTFRLAATVWGCCGAFVPMVVAGYAVDVASVTRAMAPVTGTASTLIDHRGASLLRLSQKATGQVYKFRDEKGKVTYSDSPPPPGQAAQEVKIEPAPPEAAPVQSQEKMEELRRKAAKSADERRAAEAKRTQDKASASQRNANCERARTRLESVTSGPPNRRLVQDADGTPRRVGAEEMQAIIAAAETDVERACGP